jgi:hypothetical protein
VSGRLRRLRNRWVPVLGFGLFTGCTLAIGYDGYEPASDTDGGAGAGSSGVGGGSFGGGSGGTGASSTGGLAGASGGTGGVAGTGALAGASGGGAAGAGGSEPDGGCNCSPSSCASGSSVMTEECVGNACVPNTQDCAPYACSAGSCLATCIGNAQCSFGNECTSGACVHACASCSDKHQLPSTTELFCAGSDTKWNEVVGCCQGWCESVCNLPSAPYAVCGGSAPEFPSQPCINCLNINCTSEFGACKNDK